MTESVPAGVQSLIDCWWDCDFTSTGPYSCTLTWHGLELRFQRLIEDVWELDEVVGDCFIHLEQMDEPYYWIGLTPRDGYDGTLHLDMSAKCKPRRIKLTARCD